MNEIKRCDWAIKTDIEREYHDHQWGKPEYDDVTLFKMLLLEGQQAGLSWVTILKKMEGMLEAYENFDPVKLAAFDEKKIATLLEDDRIIKNPLKVQAMVHNGKVYIEHFSKPGDFSRFLWAYVNHKPMMNHFEKLEEVPATTPLSEKISKDLKKLGFKFVGPTTVYAFMQSVGMVNDHLISCNFR